MVFHYPNGSRYYIMEMCPMLRRLRTSFPLAFFFVALIAIANPCIASHPSLVTGNSFVWAEVDDSTGWISFAQGPVKDRTLGGASHTLSHKEGSFLSVMINGTEYTNDCEWRAE